MSVIDYQDKHRNRHISRSRTSRGELRFGSDAPVTGNDYQVTTVPAGAIVTNVWGVSLGAGSVDATVKIDGDTASISITETVAGAGNFGNKVYPEDQVVAVSLAANMTKGRIIVGVEYIDLDNVTGETVPVVR